MCQPIVSVIVPCYKIEDYIDRCIISILTQSLEDLEVILVDDGSPGQIPLICDLWGKKDNRIKVIHKQNEGLGFARNSALDVAKGKYVAFVDGDDYVDSCMFENLVNIAEGNEADVVFCGFMMEVSPNKWIKRKDVDTIKFFRNEQIKTLALDMIACAPYINKERLYEMSVWHSLYKREIIDTFFVRFNSERMILSEDLPFNIDFLMRANIAIYIPETYYFYCLNEGSLTQTFKYEKYERMKSLYYLLMEKVGDSYDGALRVNRFFIGYVRSYLLQLQHSNAPQKRSMISNIIRDNIWITIRQSYKSEFLPLYPRIFYLLILKQQIILLQLYASIILFLKKIANKR